MSREAKSLLRVAVLSFMVTLGQIQRLQTEVLASGIVGPCELKKNHEMTPVLDFEGTLFESIKIRTILANAVAPADSFAESTTNFKSLDKSCDTEDFESSNKLENLIIIL